MHLWVAFAVLVLGRARCIDQCGIDNGALAQRQATVTQIAIDNCQDASSQFVFLQQATEVEDGGFVGDTLQAQPRELPQDGGLVQCLFHRRIAVAKPVLHQMNPQHRHQRIGRTSAFTLGVVGLDQGNQTLPWHYPIHFDQEQLFAGLLALAGVLGVGESHLLHRATRRVGSGYFAKSGSLLQSVLKKIRNAFICIGQIYNDITFIVYKYLEVNELKDSGDGDHHLQGLGMARLGAAELKFLVQKLTGVAESDYDKFSEFFFCGEGKNGSLSLKFMPPFWSISDDVYFCPALVPTLLGTRNLLISILIDDDKNTKYNYDGLISHFFEPELLRRAQRHFESNGFYTYLECDFTGGEIDLLVFCNKSNTVMTVQAKATLYPESARMVRRLDDRIREAVEQTKRFDKLEPKEKTSLFKKSFLSLDDSAQINHIRAVLTNSSFGSTFSWQLLESNKITPINCNLLKNVLPCCNVLTELPEQIEAFIAKIKSEIEITEEQKVFSLPGHTIYQRHVETHRMKNLYDAKYWGE